MNRFVCADDCSTPGYVSYLNYMDSLSMSFTAWAWWAGDCGFPSLITSWTNPIASLTEPGKLVAARLNFGGSTTTTTTTTGTAVPPSTTASGGGGGGCVTLPVYVNALSAGWESWRYE